MGIFRRSLQVLLLVATLLVGAAAAAIVVTQTAWFRDWARGMIVSQGNRYLDGTLSIDRLGGNLFFGVELENLSVEQRGERIIAVRNAGVDYSIIQLITGDIVIDHLRLDEPRIVLRRENGRLNLGTLVKRERREKDRTGPGRSVSIGEIGISGGSISVEDGAVGTSGTAIPRVFDKLDASIGFEYEPVHYTVRIGHLSFRGERPQFELNSLSGEVSQRDDDLFLDDVAVRTGEHADAGRANRQLPVGAGPGNRGDVRQAGHPRDRAAGAGAARHRSPAVLPRDRSRAAARCGLRLQHAVGGG